MLTIALSTGVAMLVLVFAYRTGLRRGRSAERAAVNRYLHDTVLPTLDALALGARPETARAQAAELRRGFGARGRSGSLATELTALVDEVALAGLRVTLELAYDGTGLAPRCRTALRDASREALRNTVRHAGTNRAVLRVEPREGGVVVLIRDHGVGFDPGTGVGFGIAESIVGRMAEVGGHAEVESRPGWGTRVCLWAPR